MILKVDVIVCLSVCQGGASKLRQSRGGGERDHDGDGRGAGRRRSSRPPSAAQDGKSKEYDVKVNYTHEGNEEDKEGFHGNL